mmetsp:Transcript_18559/g.60352  ORF Transcript_18559/g.60352 Transcript_18559/m.60352 type:complete len:143 (+) Transcript_18559:272-700(+)
MPLQQHPSSDSNKNSMQAMQVVRCTSLRPLHSCQVLCWRLRGCQSQCQVPLQRAWRDRAGQIGMAKRQTRMQMRRCLNTLQMCHRKSLPHMSPWSAMPFRSPNMRLLILQQQTAAHLRHQPFACRAPMEGLLLSSTRARSIT